MRRLPVPHPGEMLLEEFLKPLGISQYRLAKAIGVPAPRIGEIIAGRRSVTADTGLRLSRFFGMSDGFWTGLQQHYDQETLKPQMAEVLAAIVPWAELSRTSASSRPKGGPGTAKRRPKV
ncbi:MAG: Antitoxin HigA [Luteibacter sp.]|uniref:HigA family addiction module antitoxin n=1 Tax=Luteibacter sp. TaxID=1886636 RepID=UPI0013851B98|nr:HigA family addiction module antitoxin [Luteibacter sp.]KAF1009661.1 MAG: Antitoxin HigA [Luteibacter sp.]